MKKILLILTMFLLSSGVYARKTGSEILSRSVPSYNLATLIDGGYGEVKVAITVDPAGDVRSAEVSSGPLPLWEISREAALKWKFVKTPQSNDLRAFSITFLFGSGRIKTVEEGEMEVERRASSSFPSEFKAEIRLDWIIPKLLLLHRENGMVPVKTCELHNDVMKLDVVPAGNDRSVFEEDSFDADYSDAEFLFPNANEFFYKDNLYYEVKKAEVLYCRTCRLKREQWIREHKKK
jgi:hypothetical protein